MENEQNEEIKKILDTLQDLENEYYGYSAKFKDILRNYNREISVEYILEEMLNALENLIIYIGSYKEQPSKREKINSLRDRDKKSETTKPILDILKNLEGEYGDYSAAFKYLLSDDNSVINVKYIAGEMIKVMKQIRTLIRKYREQIAEEEKNLNSLSDEREPIDNGTDR